QGALELRGLSLRGWATRRLGLQDPDLTIEGIFPPERGSTGEFAWTHGRVSFQIGGLRPNARVVVALELVDAGRVRSVQWGANRVATVAPDGMLVGPGEERASPEGAVSLVLQ